MRAGTLSWRTRTPTCRSLVAESLSQRRCIILCDSTAETECTPDIYRVILLRTAASACHSNTPLRFLMRCRSGLPSPCSAGRQSTATTQANRNRVFSAVHVLAHSWVRASRLRLLQCGGGETNCSVRCFSRWDSVFQMPLGTAHATAITASFLQPLSGLCWCWLSWARSKAGQDQPGY
jgi:hypothetical protein